MPSPPLNPRKVIPMEPSVTPVPAPPVRRIKKRWLIPGLLLVLLIALLIWAGIRGTWADLERKNPSTVADGPVCQLFLEKPPDQKVVRCAMLLGFSAEEVWRVVTDYDHFDEIFPYLHSTRATCEGGNDKHRTATYHLTGMVHSKLFGDWPFDTHVEHRELSRTVSWIERGHRVTYNAGSWEMIAKGPQQTLLVYSLAVEVTPFPDSVVRNVLLDHVKEVVTAVDQRLKKLHSTPP